MGLNGLVCRPLWLCYRYTGDKKFLRDVAYPVLRECARFSHAYLSEEADGLLHIVPTVSPEHWGLTPNFERNRDCISALTLTRFLLRSAAAAARELGEDGGEADAWLAATERLAPYPTFPTPAGPVWVDVAGAPPIEYNAPVPLSPVFWGEEVGLDSPPEILELAKRTLAQIKVWNPHLFYLDVFIRPRLGMRPVEIKELFPQDLLISHHSIHLFPAAPLDVEIVMENFCAEGGFRVSAVRSAKGEVGDARILSVLGGECRVATPWPGQAVEVVDLGGALAVRAEAAQAHLVFDTREGETYLLRPEMMSGPRGNMPGGAINNNKGFAR